jgi:hypothetical protein
MKKATATASLLAPQANRRHENSFDMNLTLSQLHYARHIHSVDSDLTDVEPKIAV